MDIRFLPVYDLNAYGGETMPRAAVQENSRMSLRLRPGQKKLILRAAALQETDLTEFVLKHTLSAAESVIERAERVQLSKRDSQRVLDLLENPPAPNARLRAAARSLPRAR